MRLDQYANSEFNRGASRLKEAIWLATNGAILSSWLPGSSWRRWLLCCFGAKIGKGVVLKPGIRVKFPWRLTIGDHVWCGEDVWIDNLGQVDIGSHSCVSQGAYLCTGSHDWSDPRFGLIVRPVTIGIGCWVAAKAMLAPGTIMEDGAVLGMAALGRGRLQGGMIYPFSGSSHPRVWQSTLNQPLFKVRKS